MVLASAKSFESLIVIRFFVGECDSIPLFSSYGTQLLLS